MVSTLNRFSIDVIVIQSAYGVTQHVNRYFIDDMPLFIYVQDLLLPLFYVIFKFYNKNQIL